MDLYDSLKTIHMIGAALLFIALGFEAIAVRRLRRAATADRAPRAFRVVKMAGRAGLAAAAVILIPGVWMMALRWGPAAWTVTALVGIVIMAVAAFRARPALTRLDTVLRADPGGGPAGPVAALGGALAASLWLRASIAIGILVLMTAKPGWLGSAATLAVTTLFGLIPVMRSREGGVAPPGSAAPARERQLTR